MDATVQTLCFNLSNQQFDNSADIAEMQNIYDDVLGDFASYPILTDFSQLTPNSSGIVTLPAAARRLLYMNYLGRTMGELSVREANWIFPNWEATAGQPQCYVAESLPARTMQLVPNDDSSTATAIYAETRQTLPAWLALPVALNILATMYGRESKYQNVSLSKACKTLADFLMQILMKGVKPNPIGI